jgi:cell wall-associated NlpC family hydrolase
VSELPRGDEPPDRATWRAAFVGAPREPAGAGWRAGLDGWWGVPYLLGGTTAAGVDCSGLVQRVYRATAGLGLPRHSLDQLRAGRRVPPARLQPGDVVFLTHAASGVSHAAIVLDAGDPPRLVHASFERGAVVEETLDALLERYRFRSARRYLPEGAEAP